MQVVIIGGGTAGTTCAFELRKLNKEIKITVIEKTNQTAYSPCSLPYLISGEIADFSQVFLYQKSDYQKNQIDLLLNSEAIDFVGNKVIFLENQEKKEITYDFLVFAPGSKLITPKIKGLEKVDYHSLKTITDAEKICDQNKGDSKSVIIGGGMIGVELATALADKGEDVFLIEKQPSLLPKIIDQDIGEHLEKELNNINVITNAEITEITDQWVVLKERKIAYDKLYVCTGFQPKLALAKKLNLKIDKGIVVNQYLQTSQKNIYAIGDCIEINISNSDEKVLSQLGTLAVSQARLVAQNILGSGESYLPALNTQITKFNNWDIGSVGLGHKEEFLTATYKGLVKSGYYNDDLKMIVKLICQKDGLLVGGQIIGHGEVAGHLHVISLAILQKMSVKDLAKLETSYNPAIISIHNPVVKAAEILDKKVTFLKDKE